MTATEMIEGANETLARVAGVWDDNTNTATMTVDEIKDGIDAQLAPPAE